MAKATRYTPAMIEECTRRGYWQPATLSDLWDRNARDYSDKEAIVDSRTRLTWLQSKRWIDRLSLGLLELGFKKDEVLCVQLPNSVELCLLRVACEKAGIICMPIQRALRHKEIEYILSRVEAKGIVIPWDFRDFDYYGMIESLRPNLARLEHVFIVGDKLTPGTISIAEMVQRPLEEKYPPDHLQKTKCPPTDFCLVLHTTGTTGLPKFVEHPICCRLLSNRSFIENLKLSGQDIVGCLSPASGGPNNIAYFAAPEVGAKVVMMEHFDAGEALELIQKERISVGCVVPAQLAMLVSHPHLEEYDLSSIRLWWCVGDLLPYPVGVDVERKMGGVIVTGLGATDWGGFTINPIDSPQDMRLLTEGKPIVGVEIKLVDDNGREVPRGAVGEVWGRGEACLSGYYRDPEATRAAWGDGWFKMGDLARWDEQGNLVVVGRKKDMIIRGGQNIYPIEIENLLLTNEKVSSAAIVGMPDRVMGERTCAFVVPKPRQEFTFAEMTAFLKQKNIAPYKLPERLEIVEQLPMVAGGQKVDKKRLQQEIAQKLSTEGKT